MTTGQTRSRRFRHLGLLAGLGILAATASTRATEVGDLAIFLPTTLEDALTGQARQSEAQVGFRFDRRRGLTTGRSFRGSRQARRTASC